MNEKYKILRYIFRAVGSFLVRKKYSVDQLMVGYDIVEGEYLIYVQSSKDRDFRDEHWSAKEIKDLVKRYFNVRIAHVRQQGFGFKPTVLGNKVAGRLINGKFQMAHE